MSMEETRSPTTPEPDHARPATQARHDGQPDQPLPAGRQKLPRYAYACDECGEAFDIERPMAEAALPAPCPACGEPARRVFTAPKLRFKADPRDVRPVWHNHSAYGHSHAPGRGRHRTSEEDH